MEIAKTNLLAIRNPKSPVHASRFDVSNCTCGDGRLGCPAMPKASGPGHDPGVRRPAAPRINRLIIQIIRSPRRLRQISPRASTGINHPQIAQLLPGVKIEPASLALRVRPHRPAKIRPLRPTRSPASANLPAWLVRIPAGTAADPSLRCARSTGHHAPPRAAPRSKTCAHDPGAAVQLVKVRASHDKV